jgi:hypothetical protein
MCNLTVVVYEEPALERQLERGIVCLSPCRAVLGIHQTVVQPASARAIVMGGGEESTDVHRIA